MEGTMEVFPWESDDEEIPARMDFPEEEIPAWMDFPKEEIPGQEGEKDRSEEKMRREMCIAWMVARKHILKHLRRRLPSTSSSSEIKEKNHEERKKKEERRRAWGKFSAEEESRAGWKVSEMDLLTELSFLIWDKKVSELEQSYAKKRQFNEAREKGLQPDTELMTTKYLEFRNKWIATHSCWGGAFEDITKIRSMSYTDKPVPQYVYNHGPPDTLQIFSVKVEGITDGELCWPLYVFGLVAVRDSIDQNRNLIFKHKRDNCQTLTKEDPYLVLTGPTRAVVMNDESIPVTIEAELKVKGTDGSKDKCLVFAAAPLPSEFGSGSFDLTAGKYGKLNIAIGRIMACVEATIFVRVIDGTWPAGFHGQIAAHTSSISYKKVVLVEFVGDVPVSDGNVDQSRFVVSVEAFGELVVSYKAWGGDEAMEGEVSFSPEKKGRSYGTLKVGSCILEILVAWSPIRPVCEELVSMPEMVFA